MANQGKSQDAKFNPGVREPKEAQPMRGASAKPLALDEEEQRAGAEQDDCRR